MQWLLEHFQRMEQALEAFNLSNISVDEQCGTKYRSTTSVSADALCLYKHLHLQYNTTK